MIYTSKVIRPEAADRFRSAGADADQSGLETAGAVSAKLGRLGTLEPKLGALFVLVISFLASFAALTGSIRLHVLSISQAVYVLRISFCNSRRVSRNSSSLAISFVYLSRKP